jgi:polyisoprenoid-binding protein YceI
MSTTEATVLSTGTWNIDPAHSSVSFSVRHLGVAKVRGKFGTFEGAITVADEPSASSVTATIDASSIETGVPDRDGHLKSPDFLDVATYPQITFQSTSVRSVGSDYEVVGDLTFHGTTKSVTLALEFNGVSPDPWGGTRAGFSASTEISRGEYGLSFNMALDGGGVMVGDKIKIELEIEAVKA